MELDSIEPPGCRRADGEREMRVGENGMEEVRQGRKEEARQIRRSKGRREDSRQGGGTEGPPFERIGRVEGATRVT